MVATTIPIWREGVLTVKKKPLYIIRQVDFPGGESVVGVYGISKEDYKRSKGTVIHKDWQTVSDRSPFSGQSALSEIANSSFKPTYKKVEKPALFTSRVVNGIGTFGGEEGLGFYEYTSDVYDKVRGKYKQGQPTGVFILLDDIKWEDDTNMDEEALLSLLIAKDKTRDGVYHLDGR